MTEEEVLKARVEELEENINFYLRNYNRLIAIGYRKSVLDLEISGVMDEIKSLSSRTKLI
jgi:hypothetical protein